MSRYSVVIFGATGFTGKHAAAEMARLARRRPDLTWAVAGRSQARLEDLMRGVAEATGEDQSHVKIIVADVKDEESLKAMCSQAQVVANCCGPYRLYGEPVVKAAVECKAHYVDVTGEPQFIETMQLKYDRLARQAGVCVVSACGYDSVPNDMGVAFLQDNFGGCLNSVESYMSSSLPPGLQAAARAHGAIHTGTWESLVLGLYHWSELKPLRKKLYPTRLPVFTPTLESRGIVHRTESGWAVPFPGADNSVVYRSQRYMFEEHDVHPVQFRAYLQLGGLLQAVMLILGALGLFLMTRLKFTCNILLKYPRLFSLGYISPSGPPREVMEATTFQVDLYGVGWTYANQIAPCNKKVVARVSGTNPGYGATVSALLQCALTLIDEPDKLPRWGGVLTTAMAFRNTKLIQKLNENGMKFEIISTTTL